MARCNPDAWVILGDNRVRACADTFASQITALDDLTITWGMSHPADGRDPAKCVVRIWDPTGELMRRRTADDLVGQVIVAGWDDPAAGTQWVMFRGRVSGATVDIDRAARTNIGRGWLITITATDPSADLAQWKVDAGVIWPAETAIIRANRVKQVCRDAGVTFDEVYFEPSTVSFQMGKVDVSGKTALELLDQFYESFGITWTYRPDTNVVRGHQIVLGPNTQWIWRIPDTQDHVLAGWYATSSGFGDDSEDYYDTVLFACELEPTDTATIDRRDNVNRYDMTYQRADGTEWRTYFQQPAQFTYRTQAIKSWLNLDSPNQANAGHVWAHLLNISNLTKLPQHPGLRWHVPTEGFYGTNQAKVLTRAAQAISVVHINADPWSAGLIFTDNSPHIDRGQWCDVQIIGGTVRYKAGRWLIDLTPAWLGWSYIYSNSGLIYWSQLAGVTPAGTFTWDAPPPARRWHRSMAWCDMRETPTSQSDPAPTMA